MKNLKLEAMELVANQYGCEIDRIIEIEKEECLDLIKIEDSSVYSDDERISVEMLLEEDQDISECNHYYVFDMKEDKIIGYFKVI